MNSSNQGEILMTQIYDPKMGSGVAVPGLALSTDSYPGGHIPTTGAGTFAAATSATSQ